MTREELASLVEMKLDPALQAKPGAVLLSGPATIAPGKFDIMGLNPGGSPADIPLSIAQNLAPADGGCAYMDECWNKQCKNTAVCEHLENGRVRPEDQVWHQRNMIALAKMLGHDTPGSLLSANAIFGRSTSLALLEKQTGFNAGRWWQGCWPVHQALIEIVRPAVIITLGYGMTTSAFGFLRRMTNPAKVERIGDDDRRGGWAFGCALQLSKSTLETRVIGVPHPSYYAPGDLLAGELRALAGAA